jgi:hypothetical protein
MDIMLSPPLLLFRKGEKIHNSNHLSMIARAANLQGFSPFFSFLNQKRKVMTGVRRITGKFRMRWLRGRAV